MSDQRETRWAGEGIWEGEAPAEPPPGSVLVAPPADRANLSDRSDLPAERRPGPAVFWMLILLGVSTFAPCIVLPEWRNYQAADIARQREQHRVDLLKAAVARHRGQLDAIQNDPTVVARLAQRDLGFHRPGETIVSVPVESQVELTAIDATEEGDAFIPEPARPPLWFSRSTWWLPGFDYDAIFCDPKTRPIVMLMSIGIVAIAVVLFRNPAAPRKEAG